MANSTNTFKHRLDIYWQDQEIIYDFRAQLQGTESRSTLRLRLVSITFNMIICFTLVHYCSLILLYFILFM